MVEPEDRVLGEAAPAIGPPTHWWTWLWLPTVRTRWMPQPSIRLRNPSVLMLFHGSVS
ncbi:hypothetical protein Smic_75700 [Streptomyces microflavus]|uniref:Uncharacterized protein n=1 Tax=Streptomyces microflavus TaxID=1919 RepID=A0A7J0D4A8_STRMI|nr:hypothetical protein Smic_75700 [Streptomyces microflavus]